MPQPKPLNELKTLVAGDREVSVPAPVLPGFLRHIDGFDAKQTVLLEIAVAYDQRASSGLTTLLADDEDLHPFGLELPAEGVEVEDLELVVGAELSTNHLE